MTGSASAGLSAGTKEAILRAAAWAPSADNSRPWRYDWQGDSLILRIDTRAGHAGVLSDSRYLLSDLAMGALIETLLLQSRALDLDADVRFFPGADEPDWVATMTFSKAEAIAPDELSLAQALPKRFTDRFLRWPRAVSAATRQRIQAAANAVAPEVALQWVGRDKRWLALRVLGLAEGMRFGDARYHQELMRSIRFDAGLKATVASGIAPARLGLARPEWIGLRSVRHWPVMRLFKWLGGARLLAARSAVLPALTASALGVIAADANDRRSVVNGGRALLRAWVAANAQGLGFQPFAAPAVFSLGFAPRPRVTERRWHRFTRAVGRLSPERPVLIICRITSARRPK